MWDFDTEPIENLMRVNKSYSLVAGSVVLVLLVWLYFFISALVTRSRPNSFLALSSSTVPRAARPPELQQQQLYTLISSSIRDRIGLLSEDAYIPVAMSHLYIADDEDLDDVTRVCDRFGVRQRALGWSTEPRLICNIPNALALSYKFNVWSFFGRNGAFLSLHVCQFGRHSLLRVLLRQNQQTSVVKHCESFGKFCSRSSKPEFAETVLAPFEFSSAHLQIKCKRSSADEMFITIKTSSHSPSIEASLLVFWPAAHESLNLVLPWTLHHFHCSSQQLALPVSGSVKVDDKQMIEFEPHESFACLDFGRGLWKPRARRTHLTAVGVLLETALSFGLVLESNFSDASTFTESACLIGGEIFKISKHLSIEPATSDPLSPWTIKCTVPFVLPAAAGKQATQCVPAYSAMDSMTLSRALSNSVLSQSLGSNLTVSSLNVNPNSESVTPSADADTSQPTTPRASEPAAVSSRGKLLRQVSQHYSPKNWRLPSNEAKSDTAATDDLLTSPSVSRQGSAALHAEYPDFKSADVSNSIETEGLRNRRRPADLNTEESMTEVPSAPLTPSKPPKYFRRSSSIQPGGAAFDNLTESQSATAVDDAALSQFSRSVVFTRAARLIADVQLEFIPSTVDRSNSSSYFTSYDLTTFHGTLRGTICVGAKKFDLQAIPASLDNLVSRD